MNENNAQEENKITRREFINRALSFVVRASGSWVIANIGLSAYFSVPEKDAQEPGHFNELIPLLIHGKKVQMIGVTHNLPTFIKHQDRIKQIIESAPFVLLEYFEEKEQKLAQPDLNIASLQPKSLTDHASSFYASVASVCAQEGKDIITVNPEGALSQEIEIFQLFGLSMGGSITTVEALIQKYKGAKVTRRQFLALACIIGFSALNWKSWIDSFKMIEAKTSGNIPQEKALTHGYNLLDWRDASTAQEVHNTVLKLDQEVPDQIPIPLFQGDGHSGMIFYAKDDQARAAKLALYPQFELTKRRVRRYRYNQLTRSWNMIDTI